jgi:NADH:ubiquinone oxidoreductase subunit 4 (subunit M)
LLCSAQIFLAGSCFTKYRSSPSAPPSPLKAERIAVVSLLELCSRFQCFHRSVYFSVTSSSALAGTGLSFSVVGSSPFLLASLVCVAFVKVPVYPFSLWLPEAHVEGSVFGSIALAAFAMKFSVALLILFGTGIFIRRSVFVACPSEPGCCRW